MESDQPERSAFDTDAHNDRIRVWPVVRQSIAVLFRHVVPFVVLTSVVAWTVGYVLFLTGLAPFLVVRDLEFSTLFPRQIASVVLHAFSQVGVEAVIAMAVWHELGGRRLTLGQGLVAVAKAVPGVLHRPFYLFVYRVCSVAILRALLYLPYHVAVIVVMTSDPEPTSGATSLIALSAAGSLFNAVVDTRLLMLVPVAAIERTGVPDSFRRCWRLTSRHWTRVLGVLVLVGCLTGALNHSSSMLLKGVAAYLREHDLTVLAAVAVVLVKGPIRAYWGVIATVCYHHIRVANGELAPTGGH